MNETLQTIFSLSLSGSLLALLLFGLRPLLRHKTSKAFQYYIWLLVLLRLVIPLSFAGSAMDLFFGQSPVTQSAIGANTAPADAPKSIFNPVATANLAQSAAADITSASSQGNSPKAAPAKPSGIGAFLRQHQTTLWLLGVILHFGWFSVSYLLFSRKIKRTVIPPHPKDRALFLKLRGRAHIRLYCSRYVSTPMLIGVFSPSIIIPPLAFAQNNLQEEFRHILIHELTHYARRDLLYKWFVVFAGSLHWFNPLMIPIRKEINRACELSCDEAVLSRLRAEERPRYGETLLALAKTRRLPAGIVTTTMYEEKHNLKERLLHIMGYQKTPARFAALSLSVTLLLTGCGMALGAANNNASPQITTPLMGSASPNALSNPSPASNLSVKVEDYHSFSRQGFSGTPYTLLTVTPEDGSRQEKRYEGTWLSRAVTGDMDGDGREDILLYLEHWGSSGYGSGVVHVLRLSDDGLMEYPSNYLQNPAIAQKCPQGFSTSDTPAFGILIGAEIIQANGRGLLRVKHWLMEQREDTIQYTDAFFNGDGWWIEEAGLLLGEIKPLQTKSRAISAKLPALHRDGFQSAELTFIFENKALVSDKRDPDTPYYYDAAQQIPMPALRESAQNALRQLYDMTGLQVESCYAFSTGDTLLFSMDKNDFNLSTFFSYSINPLLNKDGMCYPWDLTIAYNGAAKGSPLNASQMAAPANAAQMSDGEIARWYYENSTFGDRRNIVGFEPGHNGFIRLLLENGDFYEASLAPNNRAIQSLTGPYPKGFAH